MQTLIFNLALVWWWIACLTAVVVFWRIQAYLQDPRRDELNAQWYMKFDEYVKQRYLEDDLDWRYRDLHRHWGSFYDSNKTPNANN